jgi:hypothetical protein
VTFWKRAQDFPPILCRLLARRKWGRPLTDTEIADRTDRIVGPPGILVVLAPIEVGKIALSTSWKGIDVYDMQAFLIGCNIDFCNAEQMKRIDSYIRSNPDVEVSAHR